MDGAEFLRLPVLNRCVLESSMVSCKGACLQESVLDVSMHSFAAVQHPRHGANQFVAVYGGICALIHRYHHIQQQIGLLLYMVVSVYQPCNEIVKQVLCRCSSPFAVAMPVCLFICLFLSALGLVKSMKCSSWLHLMVPTWVWFIPVSGKTGARQSVQRRCMSAAR